MFRLARIYITRIPNEITRHLRVRGMASSCRATLLKLLDSLLKRVATVLFPTDGHGLYSAFISLKDSEGKVVRKMINLMRKLRRGSVEKREIRACLFSSVKGRELYDLMRNTDHLRELVEDEDEDGHGNNLEVIGGRRTEPDSMELEENGEIVTYRNGHMDQMLGDRMESRPRRKYLSG